MPTRATARPDAARAEAEVDRLAALSRYVEADLPPVAELAGLVRVAATVAGVPTATLNLLGTAVQVNHVAHGFDGGSCALEDSLCGVALAERSALHVPDARLDPRFAASPWVDGRLDTIRLYASSPVVTPDGWMIGTLCVFDSRPGALAPEVLEALDDLAAQAMALLERRRLTRTAQDATSAKSTFLASASHELRTPLHAVLGVLDLLAQDELPQPARAHAVLARRAASSMLVLVDDLLELSRGEAGELVLQNGVFDPAALVRDVGATLGVLAQRKGLSLRTRIAADVPEGVVGDAGRVRQVLVNLLGNALKFTRSGGVVVELSGRAGTGGADLRLAVTDTGEGIPTDELATLFTPYAQGGSGRRHGGTGLGLSICAGLAEAMGGRLTVDSTVGRGSTFTLQLTLPVAEPDPEPALDRADALPSFAGLRVLVADDSPVNRLVALSLLQVLGAHGEAVEDGEDAVARAATGLFDVVLLDHEMPGLDGPDAARSIRALPGRAGSLPIYALTGRVGSDDVATCRAAGMDGVLAKPLDAPALSRTLATVPRR